MAASALPIVTDIHPKSYIGGFQFNNGRSYRIFYQDNAGVVHACLTDDWGANWSGGDSGKWTKPGDLIVPTPITSCIYSDKNGGNSRTFWITKDYKIYCFAVGSSFGDRVIGDWKVAPYSRLGVISWVHNGDGHMRLYFQSPDDHIQELCWDVSGEWTTGHKFPATKKGTALSFINLALKASAPIIRGYYQHTTNHILEVRWEAGKGWHEGPMNIGPVLSDGYDTAHISACASTAGAVIQYWAVNSSQKGCHLTYERWEDKNGFKGSKDGQLIVPCFSQDNPHFLATCHVPENSDQTRVKLFF
ncbi:hypothetical protein K469DRAFT_693803 [Zopfia rhizophila CBS 207.26]|uniref:Uncharacterized protein n=1 Tax=Zopfia rhizophila CBS 207.26 TaxID=1314779 RepID=A0A6A6DMT2_9PEZI|nr:hypothetical protein K469DRAFT_693803 [Zopfia rhizophila CBS 207.26]